MSALWLMHARLQALPMQGSCALDRDRGPGQGLQASTILWAGALVCYVQACKLLFVLHLCIHCRSEGALAQ